jgi:hypothetical protein
VTLGELARPNKPRLGGRYRWEEPNNAITGVGLAAGMALWYASLDRFRLDDAGSLGILDAIPLIYVASLMILAGVFGLELARERPRELAIGLTVACLVVVMFSVPNAVDRTSMMPAGYVHAGFVEYISEHHEVLRTYDARFYWPAFFAVGSLLTGIAGLPDARPLLEWSPVFFELLALPPVLLLARSVLGRGRAAWLAVILYFTGCWFAQDYFAPQAMAHVLYLSVMAVLFWTSSGAREGLLRTARTRGWRMLLSHRPDPPAGLSDASAFGIQLTLTVIVAAMVFTHQLTPIGFTIQLAVLSVLGATRYRALWLVAFLLCVAWFSYGATDFWRGHLEGLMASLGDVDAAVDRGLTSRVSAGDPTYLQMQQLRTFWSGMYLALGAIGGLVLLRRRSPLALAAGAAGVAPFALVALQSYGGEIFLRCFLYAMPFLAVLTAAALSPMLRAPAVPRGLLIATVVAVAALGLVSARGVNVAFERVDSDAVAAAEFVTEAAPHGSTVALVEPFTPLGYADIETLKVRKLGRDCELRLVECAGELRPDYVLISREQERFGQLRMRLPEGWLMKDGSRALRSAGYQIVFERPDAVVLRAAPGRAP